MTVTIPLWLVRVAARNSCRFMVQSSGDRILLGVTSSGDMLAWHG